jgi:hypothetical protein
MAKVTLENSIEDFQITGERTGEAARWKEDIISSWMEKVREVCGDVLGEAMEAIRELRKGRVKRRESG